VDIITAEDLKRLLDYGSLINAIDDAFGEGIDAPERHHHTVTVDGGRDSTLLLMPAWDDQHYIGIKTVCAVPENAAIGLPAIQATYQLFDRATGRPLALLDGPELTARRTASASALASRYLSRDDCSTLLVIGTGVLSPHLIRAHAAARALTRVYVWGRNFDKAKKIAADFSDSGYSVEAVRDLDATLPNADIVSCATLSLDPLVKGALLMPGQHVDLIGGFTPLMRESDDDAVRRARLYVDTQGACTEAGDISQPLDAGIITRDDIQGDLFTLVSGDTPGRSGAEEITLFKSAGCALEDLAGARLAYERATRSA